MYFISNLLTAKLAMSGVRIQNQEKKNTSRNDRGLIALFKYVRATRPRAANASKDRTRLRLDLREICALAYRQCV